MLRGKFDGGDLLVLFPSTYMNRSGEAVRKLVETESVPLDATLVVVDDLYLPFGAIRFRRRGGDGGHNGLTSIIQSMGTDGFPRLRIGVGPLPGGVPMEEFVLGEFTTEESSSIPDVLRRSGEAIEWCLREGIMKAMDRYNGRAGAGPDEEVSG